MLNIIYKHLRETLGMIRIICYLVTFVSCCRIPYSRTAEYTSLRIETRHPTRSWSTRIYSEQNRKRDTIPVSSFRI